MKKKFGAIILSVFLAVTMCSLTACNLFNPDKPDGDTEKLAYVSLDINPAVELIVDKDNKVVSVRGENEDGQVLLYEETGIEGEKIDDAINKITDLAVKYGYLDENNKVVDTIVSSGDNDFATEILSKVNTSITATAANLGLTVTTDGEGAYSLLRKMNEVKKQFPNNSAIQNMSVQKFKLALSVSETGDISLDAAVALNDAALIQMLKEVSPQIEEFATATYLEVKTKALAAYEQVAEIAGYSVYTKYYLENMTSHLMTAYYGGVYQMYASAATGFSTICDVAELAAQVDNYPLNTTQIEAIVTALGMESADALKNSKGEVTIESIEAYADKLFKNTPASDTLEQTKAALTEALAQAEAVIKEKVNEMTEEYKPQIEAALTSARNILTSVEEMFNSLPDAVKTVMETCTADLKEILAQIDTILAGEKIELDELRTLSNRLEVKAQEYLNKIKADLSEEEWADLEAKKAAEIAKYTSQKEELDRTLDEAAQAAKEYLKNLKEQRIKN
ncbi:MAG: hypothetical protein NC132_05250 [Corallococcus sp.]|nr:hypothetical protein [Corallococcus sp.]MCM1359944.1 hypothetical protein [Corallococcus sp.]MCM1395500.1 hypothetical protein [Corallococcus sp.]